MQPGGQVEYYTCPMPEHSDVHEDKPGKCPKCAMTLIPVMPKPAPVAPEPDGHPAPSVPIPLYTCPMHPQVKLSQPGTCPICQMKLVPLERPKSDGMATDPEPGATEPVLYTCPMASHADVVTDQPGKCPKCEMDLVPASTVPHGKVAEANWRKQHPTDSSEKALLAPNPQP